MADKPSVSDRFSAIDAAALEQLGSKVIDAVMIDIHNRDLSLRQVADRSGVNMGDVVQIARFHKIDPVTLKETS